MSLFPGFMLPGQVHSWSMSEHRRTEITLIEISDLFPLLKNNVLERA
jgi:hypothetical protein